MGSTNSLRSYLLGQPRSIFERVIKVGNQVYWRNGDKFYTKGPDGVRREISQSQFQAAKNKGLEKGTKKASDARADDVVQKLLTARDTDEVIDDLYDSLNAEINSLKGNKQAAAQRAKDFEKKFREMEDMVIAYNKQGIDPEKPHKERDALWRVANAMYQGAVHMGRIARGGR
jgi:hypothetical protein